MGFFLFMSLSALNPCGIASLIKKFPKTAYKRENKADSLIMYFKLMRRITKLLEQ